MEGALDQEKLASFDSLAIKEQLRAAIEASEDQEIIIRLIRNGVLEEMRTFASVQDAETLINDINTNGGKSITQAWFAIKPDVRGSFEQATMCFEVGNKITYAGISNSASSKIYGYNF